MSETSDYLLYALSAWRETSWPKFKELFGSLYAQHLPAGSELPATIGSLRSKTIRALETLGHCDVYFDAGVGKIYIAPSMLVRLPMRGLPQAVLCGARGPQTVSELSSLCRKSRCKLNIETQEHMDIRPYVPRRIVIEAYSSQALASLADILQVKYAETPPAWLLLGFAPSLDEYLESLLWSPEQEINWQRQDYDADCLQFVEPANHDRGPARLSRYKDPRRNVNRYYLWKEQYRAQVDLEWGRYALLKSERQGVLLYDSSRALLGVPSSAPLPRLMAKAITMCTGHASWIIGKCELEIESPEQYTYDVYAGIPCDIAQSLASKLGQNLVQHMLPIEL